MGWKSGWRNLHSLTGGVLILIDSYLHHSSQPRPSFDENEEWYIALPPARIA